jgi:glucose-6-phosphate 1-dehydrogenase
MHAALSSTVLVIYGATGDLMARKVVPALYHLKQRGLLPKVLRIVGWSRRDWTDEDLRSHVRGILGSCCPDESSDEIERFLEPFHYHRGTFDETDSYKELARYIGEVSAGWGVCPNRLFFLAVPPDDVTTILENMAASGLTIGCSDESGWTRILLEKPFGANAETSRQLSELLGRLFREEQIYRIDHYLAKELLQGIMDFRFANNLFEGEWNRNTIERIEISLLEEAGMGRRGAFYDTVGTLRDVGQNHLLEMLALITMDRPASDNAVGIREARAGLLRSLRPMTPNEVVTHTLRGQYAGFRDEAGVDPASGTETFFSLRTSLHGPRWAGVPVLMQSGKRLGSPLKEIVVTFRHPERCFCETGEHHTNRIIFRLEPVESISIVFWTKKPGFDDEVEERTFDFFLYEKAEKAPYVEEYAKLLYDAVRGDQRLFTSTEEVEACWRFVDPIQAAWRENRVPLVMYEDGSPDVVSQARGAIAGEGRGGEVGVVGLGKMGAGLARNLIDNGWRVVGWNRTTSVAEGMGEEGLVVARTFEELVEQLDPPRAIWLMLPAGAPVDHALFSDEGLARLLSPGDVVIDGGNSYFRDARERAERLSKLGVAYLDCGTSGGPAGARHGACLMIGGPRDVFERLEPMFADIAVPSGYAHFGENGAGHFVKMVHNGIEYGMMQSIAEGFELMHDRVYDLDLAAVSGVYQHGSVVESRLVGWLRDAYEQFGDDLEGASPIVGHTGEGRWAVDLAKELGVSAPAIEAALRFRETSSEHPSYTGQVLTALRNAFGGHGLEADGGPRR